MQLTKASSFGRALTSIGVFTASPWAFAVVAAFCAIWLIFERQSFDFHAVATLFVWMMTLIIQRAEHRDTQAIHAKLDELLTADARARSSVSKLDEKEPEEIARFRERARASGNSDPA